MEGALLEAGRSIALAVEAVALLLIVAGTVESLIGIVRVLSSPRSTGFDRRAVWLGFANWLVAAMTFQLAADIVGTSFSPGWDEVARLGAIAAIRTFLSYFL